MKRVIWTGMAILSLATFVGCGGDDKKDNGISVNTGLDDAKVLNTLTATELQQFCEGLGAADQNAISKEDGCKSAGFFSAYAAATTAVASGAPMPTDADLQAACTQIYDQCMQATPQAPQKTCAQPDATCTATVGEAEACYGAMLKAMADGMKSSPSCSAITAQTFAPQDAGAAPSEEQPAECTAVTSKCASITTIAPIPMG